MKTHLFFVCLSTTLTACAGNVPTLSALPTTTATPIPTAEATVTAPPPQPSGILASVCRQYQAQVREALDASDYSATHPHATLFDIPAALRHALESVAPPIPLAIAHQELIAYIDEMADAFDKAKTEMAGGGCLIAQLERATKVIDEFNNAPNAHLAAANSLFAIECGFDLTPPK